MKSHSTVISSFRRPSVWTGVLVFLFLLPASLLFAQRPVELEDLFRARRVADPQLSPDGKWVAYAVTVVDKAANTSNSDIWIISSRGDGEPRQLTSSPKHDRHPRWSPDGQTIAFESNRDGAFQIYLVPASGGDARQLTTISTEATQPVWSPTGAHLAFVSGVFPEFSEKPYAEADRLNKEQMEARDKSKMKGKVFTRLLYRHWDSWVDGLRQHLFVVPAEGGEPRNVTPGDRDGNPTSSTFSAGDDYAFSPDGAELAYTATPVPIREEAWSTNHDIFTVNLTTGERKQLTVNPAADGYPRYSPDGRYIAYRAQARPSFEADRWQLMLHDRKTGKLVSLTESFDSNVDAFTWAADSKKLYFDAQEKGNTPLWSVSIKGNDVKKVYDNATNGDVSVSKDGKMLVFAHQTMTRPVEIYTASTDGKTSAQLTKVNDELFSRITLPAPEYVWYTGAGGAQVQMWIVKPADFDPAKTYPLVFWVHGGPQGAFGNSWSYRWNPTVWAAQGYVVALPNPRGSTGFGQQFTDEISKDWGGKVYDDVMNGVAYMEALPYIDKDRMAAAGASYGGYMMNWMQGHTNKFKAMVVHDGVYNFVSMYGGTEEVWFDEWEHGIPWENPEAMKFSPHLYAKNFQTPALIVHGERDFRVPVSEGMQLFTTLQRKGIPSKFLYFPDEGHWVLKPQNSEFWHQTIFDWLATYLKDDGVSKH